MKDVMTVKAVGRLDPACGLQVVDSGSYGLERKLSSRFGNGGS
jgi:hypothetical protein